MASVVRSSEALLANKAQVASHLPDLVSKTSSITFLPIEVLKEAIDLVQKFVNGNDSSYEGLLLVCGVFRTPTTGKSILLPWSPLRTAARTTSREPQDIPHKEALDWLLNELSGAVVNFGDKVRDMWKQEWPQRCFNFLTQGIQGYFHSCLKLY